jgi:hypothetical protein
MSTTMTYDEAIQLLKKAVKFSHLLNQKHVDLSVAQAHERASFEEAMIITRAAVVREEKTEEELKKDLGLIA